MQITDMYGQRFHLNPNNVDVAYKTAEGEGAIDLSNGETLYLTEDSYKRVVAWMLRQHEQGAEAVRCVGPRRKERE